MFRRFTSLFFLQVIIMATMMVCASPAPAPFAYDQYARGMSDDVASRGIFSSFKKHMKKLNVDDFKKAIGVVGEGMNKVNSAINSRGLDEPLPRGFFDDLKGAINVVHQGLDVVNSAVNQRDLNQRGGVDQLSDADLTRLAMPNFGGVDWNNPHLKAIMETSA